MRFLRASNLSETVEEEEEEVILDLLFSGLQNLLRGFGLLLVLLMLTKLLGLEPINLSRGKKPRRRRREWNSMEGRGQGLEVGEVRRASVCEPVRNGKA